MKIIGVDNLNRDNVSDEVVAEKVTEFYAKIMVEALNKKLCHNFSSSSRHYVIKPDEYVPFIWEP